MCRFHQKPVELCQTVTQMLNLLYGYGDINKLTIGVVIMDRYEYDLKPVKIVRDLIHGYINLTKYDLQLIDTDNFQRLKDIRQLTCDHVYPSARHTRFEHSLGVMELTRMAIKHINKNGFIENISLNQNKKVVSDELLYNASVAALLHDVGHSPFSHMGESMFDSEKVRQILVSTIEKFLIDESTISEHLKSKLIEENSKEIGSVHEQLSCIVILSKYKTILDNLKVKDEKENVLKIDYELIIRSILGIEYKVDSIATLEENGIKNIIVRLINSSVFDMDKLDYIMRDSFYTGIGTPQIDTKRLFRNIYLNENYNFVFTSKAVPPLQNMIDARDGLYMYVYNHHAVVFSDFLYTYIARRISKNTNEFLMLKDQNNVKKPEMSVGEDFIQMENHEDYYIISNLGLVSLDYMFSVSSVLDSFHSDSDWNSLLNVIYTHGYDTQEYIVKTLISEFEKYDTQVDNDNTQLIELSKKIGKTLGLIKNLKNRCFLKPWWKTVFEYNNFMNKNFRDDIVRKKVGKYICNGGQYGLDPSEFRSQIAKHVIYITQKLYGERKEYCRLISPLEEGDFFVIQRSTRFFSPNTIEQLEICLNDNEILGAPSDVEYKVRDYYVKSLTNIIPQKNYSSIYAKEGFYVFSRPMYPDNENTEIKIRNHYKQIESIFVFVVTELVKNGEQKFNSVYISDNGASVNLQQESLEDMYNKYISMNL